MTSEKTYHLNIDYLPDEYREKAEIQLKETPENNVRLLEELKIMAKSDEGTKEIEFHEDLLRQFLRQSKYNVPKSLRRLQAFTKFRGQNENFFRNVEDIKKSNEYQVFTPLPWRCREGCTIILFEIKFDPSGITFEDLFRLGLIIFQQSLRNPLTQINGCKMIVDWKCSNRGQLKYMQPKSLFSAYKGFSTCSPARNKEFHFVNESAVWRVVWSIVKPILPEKIKNRVFIHSSPEDLLNYFPKHTLPLQYGGDLENYFMEDWMIEANEQQRISTLAGQCNNF